MDAEFYDNSANQDSPLFKDKTAISGGIGLVYTFLSAARVKRQWPGQRLAANHFQRKGEVEAGFRLDRGAANARIIACQAKLAMVQSSS